MRVIIRGLFLLLVFTLGFIFVDFIRPRVVNEPLAIIPPANIEESEVYVGAPLPIIPTFTPPPPTNSEAPLKEVTSKPVPAANPVLLAPPPPPPTESALSDQEFYSTYSKAAVQIFCVTSQQYFSASGIIVNERGLILTNAHVAEIVQKAGQENCEVRHGNPANKFADLEVVFVANTEAKITDTKVPQHDFSFLKLKNAREPFNSSSVDLSLATEGERLLTLGYPSEFLEGISASQNANLVFSSLVVSGLVNIDNDDTHVDAYLFNGGIALQQGSSGTAVFSRSGKVRGIIFATTKSETTENREGVALMTSAIDRELKNEMGVGIVEFIKSQ